MANYKVILAFFIGVTIFVLCVTLVIYISSYVCETEPETNFLPIRLTYPDSMFQPLYGNNTPICSIKFLLRFDGTLAESNRIEIINATAVSHVPYNLDIIVGFPQAIEYNQKDTIGDNTTFAFGWAGTDILIFHDNYTAPDTDSPFKPIIYFHNLPLSHSSDIYFPVSGDYSPIIMIVNPNNPYDDFVVYRYDQIKVHIASAIEVEGLKINKTNLNLTHALFLFSLIGEFVLLYELYNKYRVIGKENDQNVININIASATNNAMHSSKVEKQINLIERPKEKLKNESNEKKT